eukprot:GDKJ01027904.1.p1 GENE.GDKJ01027904.1~~GDKJ01027904.1.p1  ORF type:complete len:126 (+),score=12.19 GDKJ01027904.1:914-1291(+)
MRNTPSKPNRSQLNLRKPQLPLLPFLVLSSLPPPTCLLPTKGSYDKNLEFKYSQLLRRQAKPLLLLPILAIGIPHTIQKSRDNLQQKIFDNRRKKSLTSQVTVKSDNKENKQTSLYVKIDHLDFP